jgi:diguanylate cyclase (GGDEF) domain
VTGDEALIRVAQTLQENFRKTDFIGRYGGDEFLMIGHIKKQEDAPKIFQRLKNKLDAKNYSGVYPYNLSASIGYVIIDPSAQTTTDQIISEADQKMYEVKTRRAKEYEKMTTDFSGIISKLEV